MANYDAKEVEKEIIEFWETNKIYQKSKERNKKGKKFYFLQGPPYTSGRFHMGHAWNNCMKDMAMRFKRMKGFNVWDRGGYDMHGLPTELKVQSKFKLKTKEDIEKFGLDKFAKECRKFSTDNAKLMNEDLWKMGVWMDHENAYMPIDNDFIESEWHLIKKAHEKKRLYLGKRTLTWCSDCETALAKHELEYKEISDKSVFLKFKVKGKENEFLIIWTTTPWTIPFNMGVMVNPELDYIRAKVGDETWILSKILGPMVVQSVAGKEFEIIEEFKGGSLEGLAYEHPLSDEIDYGEVKKKSKNPEKVHTVVLSDEFVDTSAGTGLVHMAPGCGPEDYEIGYRNGIYPFNSLDEKGIFPDNMGMYSGWTAKKDDLKFIASFEEKGCLIEKNDIDHDYAHCWRCKNPVIFRTTEQWFLKIEDLKDRMIEDNKSVNWIPEQGKESYDLWTKNLRDNSITKQRFWGTPAPIWVNEKDKKDYIVIGSRKELENLGAKVPDDLHKPWIDDVVIEKEGKVYRRIPDVLDVWIDSGTTSWNCLHYPQRTDLFEEFFPADFILEAREQVRLWFSMLNICSHIVFDRQAFNNVYMTGMITDVDGVKMSKSLGNIISPYEIIDKHGVDTMRYYLSAVNAAENISFSWEEVALKSRLLMILWNTHKFLIDLCKTNDIDPIKISVIGESVEDRYMLSKLNSAVKEVTELYDSYKLDDTIKNIEDLYLSLSREYIQFVRDRANVGDKEEKEAVIYVIYNSLSSIIKMFNPVCPFICEKIYQNLKKEFKLECESINLLNWPECDEKKIDKELEKNMGTANNVIQSILYAREKAGIGLRWPLKEVLIVTKDKDAVSASEKLADIIKNQTNIKEIRIQETFEDAKESIKPDYAKLGPKYGSLAPKVIAHLATSSTDTIMSHINKEGKYMCKIDGNDIEVLKEDLVVEREIPEPFKEAEFSKGHVYINSEMDKELEAEGYSRELMRRVQSLRKKEGFEKKDSIILFIKVPEDILEGIRANEEAIAEKVGASKIKIDSGNPARKHDFMSKEKIKGKEFEICFDRVE